MLRIVQNYFSYAMINHSIQFQRCIDVLSYSFFNDWICIELLQLLFIWYIFLRKYYGSYYSLFIVIINANTLIIEFVEDNLNY